jgi:hypothetical protein
MTELRPLIADREGGGGWMGPHTPGRRHRKSGGQLAAVEMYDPGTLPNDRIRRPDTAFVALDHATGAIRPMKVAGACRTTWSLTEPRRARLKAPCPRDPTTIRSAPMLSASFSS